MTEDKELRYAIINKMAEKGFTHLLRADTHNYDGVLELFHKGPRLDNKAWVVAVSISALEAFNLGDNYKNLVESRCENAAKTWEVAHND